MSIQDGWFDLAVATAVLVKPAELVTVLLPAAAAGSRDAGTWLDVGDTMRETYGYSK